LFVYELSPPTPAGKKSRKDWQEKTQQHARKGTRKGKLKMAQRQAIKAEHNENDRLEK
jgi:hypothetical protein